MRRATDLPEADAPVGREGSLRRARLGAPPPLTQLLLDAALRHDRHAATKRQSLSGHEREMITRPSPEINTRGESRLRKEKVTSGATFESELQTNLHGQASTGQRWPLFRRKACVGVSMWVYLLNATEEKS